MANATTTAFGFQEFVHQTLPDAWTASINFLVSYLGEATTFVLLCFVPAYLVRIYNNAYFQYIYKHGYHEKYRIQNDRRVPQILEDAAWERLVTSKGLYGIFVIALPQQYLGYFVMNRIFGMSVHSMPKSWSEAAWSFFVATFVWDTVLFWVHFAEHKIPWLYVNVHKKHHEVKTVSTLVSGHAWLIDLIIMDFIPTRIGMIAAHLSFPTLVLWNVLYTHSAIRAHCGYALPSDPLNWFVPYVENHDFHHRRTHANYETMFFVWDWLVGGFGDFWEWRKKRWDPKQWKDGVGFINKDMRELDGEDAVWGETAELVEKMGGAKKTK